MKKCATCGAPKETTEFYMNGSKVAPHCKKCHNKKAGDRITEWRREVKRKLVEHHGGACTDCGVTGPPFMFDFDHRDPAQKSFDICGSKVANYGRQLEETLKCDLVCPNCHRWRTHRQRCSGCAYCSQLVE